MRAKRWRQMIFAGGMRREKECDAEPGRNKVHLALKTQYLNAQGERFELKPGMRVVAEIHLGERTIMDYLLSPVQKTVREAGRER